MSRSRSKEDDWIEDNEEDWNRGITRESKLAFKDNIVKAREVGRHYEVVRTLQTGAGTDVWLAGAGVDLRGKIVWGHLHHDQFDASHGQIPLELELRCPRCDQVLKVDGTKKTIKARKLDAPVRFVHPHEGMECVQTYEVTVDEPLTCPWPSIGGKGVCGYRFVIRDDVISKA